MDEANSKSEYYDRNALVHAVIWPNGREPQISLYDTDGVLQGTFAITEPVRGSELARVVPEGFFVDPSDCKVGSMNGRAIVGASAKFDTAVVTQRAEVTFEERMARLERREAKRQARQEQLERQNKALMAKLQAVPDAGAADEYPVVEREAPQEQQEVATDE